MPKKEYKTKIMQTLKQYHNPFRLTTAELQQVENLLTEIENGAHWTESLQTLADILEVLPLEIHDTKESHDAAVQRDAGLQHQPIHVYAASDRNSVLEALSNELEFQRTHALYRYMNDELQRLNNDHAERVFLAACKDIADSIERKSTKDSVTALLDNYSRTHGAPDLAKVTKELVGQTEELLLSRFVNANQILGYSGPDIMNISLAFNDFTKKRWNDTLRKNEASEYRIIKNALTQIHEMDAEFQERMRAFTALQSQDPKDAKLNTLIEDVRENLNMKDDADGFSLNRVFMNKENCDLNAVCISLDDTSHLLYYGWREKSGDTPRLSGKEKARFKAAEDLRATMEKIQGYLNYLTDEKDIYLGDYTVTGNWKPDYRLMTIGNESTDPVPDEHYRKRLAQWHADKLQRKPELTKSEERKEKAEALRGDRMERQEGFTYIPGQKRETKPVEKKPVQENAAKAQPATPPVIRSTSGKEFYEYYDTFIKNYGDAGRKKINSNDVEELTALYNSNVLGADGKDYLAHRIEKLQDIHALEAKSVPGKAPETKPSANGSIVLPTVQRAKQSSGNGCWSVSLATQLQYRGVELDQKTIRAFRPDTEIADRKDVACANRDTANYLENYAELVQNVLPDTAFNNVTCETMDKAADAEKCLRACVDRALVKSNSPLSIVFNGHYRTIYGIEKDPSGDASKDVLLFHDPLDTDPHRATVQEFVDLCDANYKHRNTDYQTDPNYKYAYQFSASWLQDLKMNEKGELGGELQKLGVSYENGVPKFTNTDIISLYNNKFETIFGGKLVPGMKNEVYIYLPQKSYSLLKAEREKTQAAEAEKLEAEKKAAEAAKLEAERKAAEEQKKQAEEKKKTEVPTEQTMVKATEEKNANGFDIVRGASVTFVGGRKKSGGGIAKKAEDISTSSMTVENQKAVEKGREVADRYMRYLRKAADRLQMYMDQLTETNTKAMWEKSSDSYKKMYNMYRNILGDETNLFDALRKQSPRRVGKIMTEWNDARNAYVQEKSQKKAWGSETAKTRLSVANKVKQHMEYIRGITDAANTWCNNMDMPKYISECLAKENAKQPIKLNAKDLESKVAKSYAQDLANFKETEVDSWTNIDRIKEDKKSVGTKTDTKAKTL